MALPLLWSLHLRLPELTTHRPGSAVSPEHPPLPVEVEVGGPVRHSLWLLGMMMGALWHLWRLRDQPCCLGVEVGFRQAEVLLLSLADLLPAAMPIRRYLHLGLLATE